MDIISILIFFIIITIISNFIEKIKNKSKNEPNSNEKFEIPTLKHKKPPIRLPNEEVKSYKTVIEEKITAEEARENLFQHQKEKQQHSLNKKNILNGIVFAQILQPPKAYQNLNNQRKDLSERSLKVAEKNLSDFKHKDYMYFFYKYQFLRVNFQ